ncbi:MAG: hypothetical protein ACI9EF_002161 [Pseudohongiellaceae bacterium]|jgi:hypothetical protein
MHPSTRSFRLLALLILALVLPVGCGGGGGGGGGGAPVVVGGGGPSGFGVVAGPTGGVITGVNVPVTLVFNSVLLPSSVTPSSVRLVTIDDSAGLTSTPAGVLASFTLDVQDSRILITPTIEFSPTNVVFGFVADALYQVTFADASSGLGIKSAAGGEMTNPGATFFFRTPLTAVDTNPGFPGARAYLVDNADSAVLPAEFTDDSGDGSLTDEVLAAFGIDETANVDPGAGNPSVVVAVSPVQDIIFILDDGVIPVSVVNPADSSSPALRVLINIPGQFSFQPVVAPATLALIHQQGDLTIVRWRTALQAYPPGDLLIVEVASTVADLGNNSKASVTGDSSPLLSVSLNVAGGVDLTDYIINEPFVDQSQLDGGNTSGDWGTAVPSFFTPVFAGGRGRDGALVIDSAGTSTDPGTTEVPLLAIVDFDAKTVQLPVVLLGSGGEFTPRRWELERLVIPTGWTLSPLRDKDGDGIDDPEQFQVQSVGHPLDQRMAPLDLQVAGIVDVAGTVAVMTNAGLELSVPTSAGANGYSDYFGQGGEGGLAQGGAGNGGMGGHALLGRDTNADGFVDVLDLPLQSPLVNPPGLPFDLADPKLAGSIGRSASLVSTALLDTDRDLSVLAAGGALEQLVSDGKILLQPNLGVGSSAAGSSNSGTPNEMIDENHPSFVVQSVTVDGSGSTIVIESSAGQSMVAPSQNIGTSFGPLAAQGDSYLLGQLAGASGTDFADLDRGGIGAAPFVVVNAPVIQTSAGGGGGGGSLEAGLEGDSSGPASDITSNQRSSSKGLSLDESPGALGGLSAMRGTGRAISGLTFDLLTSTAGFDPLTLAPGDLVGYALVPDAPSNGWRFLITGVSPSGVTLTVDEIRAGAEIINLTTGAGGVSGPGLSTGVTVPYLLLPPFGVAGAGGGGSGVSVTGTVNSAPSSLPLVSPGAGGGAGGSSVRIETAKTLTLRANGEILAEGGAGGFVTEVLGKRIAGGGGGGGGNIDLSAGQGLVLFQGARVSAAGGLGGGSLGQGQGGTGGAGYVRFEDFSDSLSVPGFSGLTEPVMTEENLGRLVSDPRSVGQSRFFNTGLANPSVDGLLITYDADTNGDDVLETGLTWGFSATGVDGGTGGFDFPPFSFSFNWTTVDSNGFLDPSQASSTFYPVYDLVSGRTGLVYDVNSQEVLYAPGELATQIHDLGGNPAVLIPTIPGVLGTSLDIVSMAYDSDENELFLLERSTGKVYVLDRTSGLYLRTITLPVKLEGAMVYVERGNQEWLVIADNNQELLVAFSSRNVAAIDPATDDIAPSSPTAVYSVSRDGLPLNIEFTGMAFAAVGSVMTAVDALAGTLLSFDFSPGNEGVSLSGSHALAQLTHGGAAVVPSSVAWDPDSLMLNIVVATDAAASKLWTVSPFALPTDGSELALPATPQIPLLPETARPIAAGQIFFRFRVQLDGLFDDITQVIPVSFRNVAIDTFSIDLRNAGF